MPEDQKGLVLFDLFGSGVPDVVCSTNNGPVRSFVPGGVWKTQPVPRLGVRLQGNPGNPTAVGARLTLRTPEGKQQRREITAGSGYLSQSEPTAWFANVPAGSKLVVRWPDGTTQEHVLDQTTGRVTIRR